MANKSISTKKREVIESMSLKGMPISYIAKKTGTCRPTVRKYLKDCSTESAGSGTTAIPNL